MLDDRSVTLLEQRASFVAGDLSLSRAFLSLGVVGSLISEGFLTTWIVNSAAEDITAVENLMMMVDEACS